VSRRGAGALARRQRRAGGVICAAFAAFLWMGAPEALAAYAGRLTFGHAMTLLVLAALLFATFCVLALLLLEPVLRFHSAGAARLRALDDRLRGAA
jgi:hypothetical protein